LSSPRFRGEGDHPGTGWWRGFLPTPSAFASPRACR
jgi:hypothetical protein